MGIKMLNYSDVRLINVSYVSFTDKTSNELVELCKMTYGIMQESTDKFSGERILEQYVRISNFDKLKNLCGKTVKAYYVNKIDFKTNKETRKIAKINEIEL